MAKVIVTLHDGSKVELESSREFYVNPTEEQGGASNTGSRGRYYKEIRGLFQDEVTEDGKLTGSKVTPLLEEVGADGSYHFINPAFIVDVQIKD